MNMMMTTIIQMKTTRKNIVMGACPECDADIIFNKAPYLGQKKVCPECRDDLEVVGLTPIELDWAYAYDDYDESSEYGNDDF